MYRRYVPLLVIGVLIAGYFYMRSTMFGTSNMEMEVPNDIPEMTLDTQKWENFTKPDDAVLRMRLTDIQYNVTQKDGTEPAFRNEYFDNKEVGIYVDIVSGEPLFSSTDKYDSGTGWPSFVRPIYEGTVIKRTDYKLVYPRTEIRSRYADSHLGHVFNDGPPERGGFRYCMNSAALRFVPESNMEEEGYGELMTLFK